MRATRKGNITKAQILGCPIHTISWRILLGGTNCVLGKPELKEDCCKTKRRFILVSTFLLPTNLTPVPLGWA
jgi:hypothetical protein